MTAWALVGRSSSFSLPVLLVSRAVYGCTGSLVLPWQIVTSVGAWFAVLCCDVLYRPTFTEILQTLDIWSAGGHGWPAVAPAARMQPRPREPPAQLQVQQQGQPSQQQQQAAVIVSPLTGPSQQAQQQQPLQQPPLQQKVFAAEAVNCVLQQDLQQRQLPPQQQQQQAQQGRETTQQHQEQSAREGAGRNMHMSWSEVDVNDGCHH